MGEIDSNRHLPFVFSVSGPYFVKAVIKNKKIKDHKKPDDSSNKALILAFFLFTRERNLLRKVFGRISMFPPEL
jgi:hypothetical protein